MKSKFSKILGVVVTLTVLASLMVTSTALPASAAVGSRYWSTVNTPTNVDDVLGGKTHMNPGFVTTAVTIGEPDIDLMTTTASGIIFAWDDDAKTLYKSIDGLDWATYNFGINATGAAVALVVSPNFATDGAVALATATEIWISTDGGTTFTSLSIVGGPTAITSLELGYPYITSNVLTIMAGGSNGVFYFKWAIGSVWTAIGALTNVLAVKISPQSLTDGEIMAVTLSGGNLVLTSAFGALGWNNVSFPDKIIVASAATPTSVTIALPSDYVGNTGKSILIGTIGATTDGLYRVSGRISSAGTAVNTGLGAVSVKSAVFSGTTVLAGIVAVGTVSRCANITAAIPVWTASAGPAMGTSAVLLLKGTTVYAGTSGADSAISVSNDGGVSFQQVGLIDCGALAANYLTVGLGKLTVVDNYTMFLVMSNSVTATKQYVFKTTDAGVSWYRIYTTAVATPLMLSVSTAYATDSLIVISDGTSALQKSTDGGMTWSLVGAPVTTVTGLFVLDADHIFVGALGGVYKVGYFAIIPTQAAGNVISFALKSSDATKATFMVGHSNGYVYETTNMGTTFTSLSYVGSAGSAYVTYAADGTRYATRGTGVYRRTATATSWSTLTTGLTTGIGIAVSGDGTLYAADAAAGANVFRTLNPTVVTPLTPTFNQLNFTGSLAGGGTLADLDIVGEADQNTVYIVDTTSGGSATTNRVNGRVQGFKDTLLGAPTITAPIAGTVVAGTNTVTFTWSSLLGANTYRVMVDTTEYSVTGVTTLTLTSATLATLTPGSTHTWSVRVSSTTSGMGTGAEGSYFSRSSAAASFILSLSPPSVQTESLPLNGTTDVAVDTIFSWPTIDGATSYDIAISEASTFAGATSVSVATNAYKVTTALKYNTTYWWRVRAVSATSTSAWTTSLFTTAKQPVVTTAVTTTVVSTTSLPQTTVTTTTTKEITPVIPSYLLWAVILVGAVLVIAVIVLIVRTRRIS